MSSPYYNTWWIRSKKELEDLRQHDAKITKTTKETKFRNVANYLVGGLYARYSMVVKSLALIYDQTATIQKRFSMRKLVDSAVIRLNELKEELCNINLSEYHYIDGNLIELKLVPYHIELLNPCLIFNRPLDIEDMWTRIKNGETIFERPPEPESDDGEEEEECEEEEEEEEGKPADAGFGSQLKKREKAPPPKFAPPVVVLTPEQIAAIKRKEEENIATQIIQNHERARQERLYLLELEHRKLLKKKIAEHTNTKDAPIEVQEVAALNIQKIFRGYIDRKYLNKREKERRLILGMTEPSWKKSMEEEKLLKALDRRRAIRDQRIREYIQANVDEKTRLLRVVEPGLFEDIGDEIREWFHRWYDEVTNFDKYPTEEEGGSILIVRGETMTPKQWLDDVEKKRRDAAKAVGKGTDPKAEEKKKKEAEKKAEKERLKKEKERAKKDAEDKRKKEAKGEFDYKPTESKTLDEYNQALKEYHEIWDERPFEENPEEKHYMDMIHEQKCYELQLEIRPKVDELMRLELDLLNAALQRDIAKAKGKKGKEKKGKGKGKGKGKKGKGKKDPTGHRTTEDLFQELVDNGIIHTYPTHYLKEFKGDFSYQNYEKRNLDFDPPATLGDVRRAVVVNCILPLGVDTMVKPKSVLIAGHRQSGKHLLANAIFTETRCVLFDLSPPILAGKYQGAKNMKTLVHLINKMSRLLQPSIIYFDGGEKPFYKKVPKEEKDQEPKKMGKQLYKGIIKTLLPEDKVLVLGISKQPFNASAGGLKKAFERVILIPRTDYGSVYLYWRELLMAFHGVDRDFNVSEVAKLTVTYPLSAIREAVETVLNPARLIQLKFKPLDAHELLHATIHGTPPVDDKEWKKFEKWYSKTPLAKRRGVVMKFAEAIREAANKKKK